MELLTKFIRLRQPVKLGDGIDGWLGGWTRDRLSYLVMLVRATKPDQEGHLRLLCHGSDAHLSDPAISPFLKPDIISGGARHCESPPQTKTSNTILLPRAS